MGNLYALNGVEIFSSGKWNGDDYSDADLDAMVAAAGQLGYQPPVKIGHEDKQGQPAAGWVANLRRVGSKLLADLTDLPKSVYEAIRGRRYDRVSSEIFWNLERNGKTFPRALKALALLGADIPAVDLQPLHELFADQAAKTHAYVVDLHVDDVLVITREQMAELCPSCAEEMAVKKITKLRIPRAADGAYDFAGLFRSYQGFNQGLCDKFGEAAGFRTRCMSHMAGKVDDEGGFCNALKIHCHGSASAESVQTPARSTSMAEKPKPEPEPQEPDEETAPIVREGEIVVKLNDLQEMKSRIAELEAITPTKEALSQREVELAAEKAAHRARVIDQKVLACRIPAFREFVRTFYDLADRAEVKTYTVGGRKDLSGEAVIDRWVTEVNKQADRLFSTLTVPIRRQDQDPDEPETPRERVDYRVRKFQTQHPTLDYRAALKAVLDADAELKAEYARS